jgi:hypothetical protein
MIPSPAGKVSKPKAQEARVTIRDSALGQLNTTLPLLGSVLQLQRKAGNQAVQRLLRISAETPSIQRQPAPPATSGPAGATTSATPAVPAPMDYTTMSADALRTQFGMLRFLAQWPLMAAFAPVLRAEAEKVKLALISKISSEEIKALLNEFQTISVSIPGTSQTLPPGQLGPAPPKQTTFHAAYYINTKAAQANIKSARDASQFGNIVKTLNASGAKSVIQSGGKGYGAGSAVLVGKATPDNVRQFTQEALNNGTIRKYAVQKGKLTGAKQLDSLSDADAQQLIQDWALANGVGVDCSGFVLQAAIRARDAVRADLTKLGVPEGEQPKALGHEERNAASFANGAKVAKPTDLRAGDAWVLNNGHHVKIVTGVRQATNAKGDPVIEIETAESAGDSTHTSKGPIAGTKQTKSLKVFGLGGSFHRI